MNIDTTFEDDVQRPDHICRIQKCGSVVGRAQFGTGVCGVTKVIQPIVLRSLAWDSSALAKVPNRHDRSFEQPQDRKRIQPLNFVCGTDQF
ncbi:hypothetical protein [Rhizobium sp. GCM10022189]|uniref:hypothetical protein n=1 Tax=Rhizobium sp. GCM10022189 TaxID=3252654 RepID=UPI003620BB5F